MAGTIPSSSEYILIIPVLIIIRKPRQRRVKQNICFELCVIYCVFYNEQTSFAHQRYPDVFSDEISGTFRDGAETAIISSVRI